MVPCLLSAPGVYYTLSERLSQDPLFNLFFVESIELLDVEVTTQLYRNFAKILCHCGFMDLQLWSLSMATGEKDLFQEQYYQRHLGIQNIELVFKGCYFYCMFIIFFLLLSLIY